MASVDAEQELIDRILHQTKLFVPSAPKAEPEPEPKRKVNKQVLRRRRRNHVELG
jgi:hypothetical protein